MRIGIFGGSFDPPHRAHLAVAIAAADAFTLDRVEITPTGRQPLKRNRQQASYIDRLAMVQLLCSADPRLHASDLDQPRADGSPNYTVDLLEQRIALSRLQNRKHASSTPDTLYNIVGADTFLDIRRWHRFEHLFTLAEWIVLSRPGFSLADLASLSLTPEQTQHVHLLQTLHLDVAATSIREQLASAQAASSELTPQVATYIVQHHLYRT